MASESYSRRRYLKIGTALTVSGLAGCMGSNSNTSNNGSSDKITIWTNAWDSPKLRKFIKKPVDVSVQFSGMRYRTIKKKFLIGADTGTPDVVESIPNHRGDFVSADLVEPLTDRINKLDYKDGYIGLDTMRYKDDIWALPLVGNGRGHVYREDIFKEYGDVPNDWSKFIEMASDITKSEKDMHGFILTSQKGNGRMPQEYFSMLFQMTDSIFKPKGNGWELAVSAKELGKAFEAYYWAPFFATDPPASNPDARGIGSVEHDIAYLNGDYASLQTGPWLPSLIKTNKSANDQARENYERSSVVHNPRVKGGEKATFLEVTPVFMNKNSENKDAAWTAIKRGTSPKGIKKYLEVYPGALPAHESVEWKAPKRTNNPDWATFKDIFETGKLYGFWSVSKVVDTFFDLSQAVMYDKIDPMEAGERMHKKWAQEASKW